MHATRRGLIVWGESSAGNLNRVLILQKKAIRTLADLEPQQSYRHAFQSMGIMIGTGLYIQGVILHAPLFGEKPSYIGRKLWNTLRGTIKRLKGEALKRKLNFLVNQPFYTLEELLEACREEWRFQDVS
ncbi:hypothetical protein J6590_019614 [Homalodisca vitripennis]|nr:hypothetical protein J6590_019614 [Homalodisca vitripennis]